MIHKYLLSQKLGKTNFGAEIFAKSMSHAETLANLINAEVVGMITEEAPEQMFCSDCLSEKYTYCPMCEGEVEMEGGH